MKSKTNLIKFVSIFLCLLSLVLAANAQKRRPGSRKAASSGGVMTTAASNSEIKMGAQKVSTQIKNLSKFIYVLGGVARGIEDIDKEAQAKRISPAGIEKNAQFKQSVIQSIRNLRAGLVALEIEFRTKPALKNYLFQIQGISDTSGIAEDQAAGGEFTQAGKTLLLVVEKLSDTLVAMP